MKYKLINEHSNINFHDARVNSVYFKDDNMVWELIALPAENIMKDISGDNCYIKNAVMILENAHVEDIIIGGYGQHYKDGILIEAKESMSASPNEYDSILKKISEKHHSEIYGIKDLSPAKQGQYRISIMVYYEIIVAFTKSIIMWNEFGGTEWCEKLWSHEGPN